MLLTLILWFYVVGSIVAGVIAEARGRSGIRWFALSLVLSPLLTVVMLALMPSSTWERHCPHCDEMIGSRADACQHCGKEVQPLPRDAYQKRTRCPECAELILLEARRCRYCAMVLKSGDVPVLSEVVADEVPDGAAAPRTAET